MTAVHGCLDGPGLAAFLGQYRPEGLRSLSDADRRLVQRWARGHQARLNTADRILTELDLPLAVVPAEFFRAYDSGRSGCRREAAA